MTWPLLPVLAPGSSRRQTVFTTAESRNPARSLDAFTLLPTAVAARHMVPSSNIVFRTDSTPFDPSTAKGDG